MDRLINHIKEITNAIYITEDENVYDNTFALNAVLSRALKANGRVQNISDYYNMDYFATDKIQLKETMRKLLVELTIRKYVCTDPEYSYEANGHIWKGTMQIISTGGDLI